MQDLISDIYEGALVGDQWPAILGRIGDHCGVMGALLFAASDTGTRWAGSGDTVQLYEDAVRLGWQHSPHNNRVPELVAARHNGFVIDIENRPDDFVANNPMYQEFLLPRGCHAAAATHIVGASGDDLVLSVEGFKNLSHAQQYRPFLDDLRPHLARAAMVASRLHLERVQAMTAALKAIGVAAAVITDRGVLRAANDLFSPLVGRMLHDRSGGIRLTDIDADKRLRDALEQMVVSHHHACSIPLPARHESPARILHLIPIAGEARDLFTGASILLVVTGGNPAEVPAQLLETLFDLTPTEARIARSLAAAQSANDIAEASGKSVLTVRTQIKAILAKTGSTSQQALIVLLKGLSLGSA